MPPTEKNIVIGSKPVSPGKTKESAALEYWTPERRAAAKPFPLPQRPKGGGALIEAPQNVGKPGFHAPQRPTGGPAGGGGPARTDYPVSKPLTYPFNCCGRLFFTQNGNGFSGSASVVSQNVLLTAGHCVFYTGVWSENVVFYPSYPLLPGISFSYSYEAAWTAWVNNTNFAYDYGMIWVDNNPGNNAGWLGMLWNASTSGRTWDAVGYPGTPNPPYNGNAMDSAIGTLTNGDDSGTIGLNNDYMQHGSSGGPWITAYNGSPPEYANGLQSHLRSDGSNSVVVGPHFTQDVDGLFNWIPNPANRT